MVLLNTQGKLAIFCMLSSLGVCSFLADRAVAIDLLSDTGDLANTEIVELHNQVSILNCEVSQTHGRFRNSDDTMSYVKTSADLFLVIYSKVSNTYLLVRILQQSIYLQCLNLLFVEYVLQAPVSVLLILFSRSVICKISALKFLCNKVEKARILASIK